jgi:hypothetical protein
MPTRRIFELVVVTSLAMRPVFGMVRLWAAKTLASEPRGSVVHGAAEIATVIM